MVLLHVISLTVSVSPLLDTAHVLVLIAISGTRRGSLTRNLAVAKFPELADTLAGR